MANFQSLTIQWSVSADHRSKFAAHHRNWKRPIFVKHSREEQNWTTQPNRQQQTHAVRLIRENTFSCKKKNQPKSVFVGKIVIFPTEILIHGEDEKSVASL